MHQQEYPSSSAEYWPNQQKIRDQLSIPLTVELSPLQYLTNPQYASFSSKDTINQYRCHSCKAFVNYFCKFKNEVSQEADYYTTYDCSICGCTNMLPKKMPKQAPQICSPVYLCETLNPNHCLSKNKEQTLVFVIDVSGYGPNGTQSKRFIEYSVNIIRNMINMKLDSEQEDEYLNYGVMILAFDRNLHEYYVEEEELCKNVNTHLEQITVSKNCQYFFRKKDVIEKVLDDLLKTQSSNSTSSYSSEAFLPTLEVVLTKTINSAGNIYFISGINKAPAIFNRGIFDQHFKQNYEANRKCIPQKILSLCEKTQMAMNFFIYNNQFVNLMPLYVISRLTNGMIRHYDYHQHTMFYHQLQHNICVEPLTMGIQGILKLRNSSGLKLAGIFGQYRRYKNFNDQIQLVSCPEHRRYIFQFAIEGKIQHTEAIIQFSILYTDKKGRRLFKIVTSQKKLTNDPLKILKSIDYHCFNSSYTLAILHNMDSKIRVRNLQIALQDRCRQHFQLLMKYDGKKDSEEELGLIKKASLYSIYTFLLLRHYLMNTKFEETLLFEKWVDMKSRMITSDDTSIHTVWPTLYSISGQRIKIIEMKELQVNQSETALIIDQGDFCHIYICDEDIRNLIIAEMIKTNNSEAAIKNILSSQEHKKKYKAVLQVLRNIKEQKMSYYVEIILLSSMDRIGVLDEKGPMGYSSFVHTIIG